MINMARCPGRYIARHTLCFGRDNGLSIVEVDGESHVSVTPFVEETAATLWRDGLIVAVKSEAVTEFLLDDLEMISARGCAAISAINDYMKASGLYPDSSDHASLLVVTLNS